MLSTRRRRGRHIYRYSHREARRDQAVDASGACPAWPARTTSTGALVTWPGHVACDEIAVENIAPRRRAFASCVRRLNIARRRISLSDIRRSIVARLGDKKRSFRLSIAHRRVAYRLKQDACVAALHQIFFIHLRRLRRNKRRESPALR